MTGNFVRPFVIDSEGERHMLFTSDYVQSSMQLDDPYALVSAYTRKMMAFLLFRPEPRHVLMIGLRGGSLAKFCHRHLPRTRISVVEISAEVISLREHFAIPPDDERFEIIHDDGAAYLARMPLELDVILIDAFDELGVAPSLASPDFYRRASRSLTQDGVLVVNLSGQKSRYPLHIQHLLEAFDGASCLCKRTTTCCSLRSRDRRSLKFRRCCTSALPSWRRHWGSSSGDFCSAYGQGLP